MGIRIGPWDPLQLAFNILDLLLRTNKITVAQAREVLMKTLPTEMTIEEKTRIVDSMIQNNPQ